MDLFSYFRNCKNCGKYEIKIELFCQDCLLKLERFRLPRNHVESKAHGIPIRAVYRWISGDETVGNVIRGLKGGTPKKALRVFALEMAERNYLDQKCVVIPVPPTKVGVKDHAYYLAKEIALYCGYDFQTPLYWVNKEVGQKFLKKTERFQNTMGAKGIARGYEKIILIDDVVTSGATAIAATRAIKGLNKIEVWSLACRVY